MLMWNDNLTKLEVVSSLRNRNLKTGTWKTKIIECIEQLSSANMRSYMPHILIYPGSTLERGGNQLDD